MINYEIFYKNHLDLDDCSSWSRWDTFISGYDLSERVFTVFKSVFAKRKLWLAFPEYKYAGSDLPTQDCFSMTCHDEAEYIKGFFEKYQDDLINKRICVDLTGFVRPYLLYLLRWFIEVGLVKFDAIYSEPLFYSARGQTVFSGEFVTEVRQVAGFEGNHSIDSSNDIMIINAGYEDQLIARAAEHKDQATKIQLFGFPSLRADMFQENVLRAHNAEESVGGRTGDVACTYFAPSNDPFVTASVLQQIIRELTTKEPITNLYLCPVATKPQLLGFGLFYLYELRNSPASIVYPFSTTYEQQTATGLSRIWKYSVELPVTLQSPSKISTPP